MTGWVIPWSEWTVTPVTRALITRSVAEVDADVLAVGVNHKVATFGLPGVDGQQAVRGEPAQVAGGSEAGAADLAQLAGVGESPEDQPGAVDGAGTLGADSVRRAQVCAGSGDNRLDAG